MTKQVFRVHVRESERGWGSDNWHRDFDTRAEAQAYWDDLVRQYGGHKVAPDFYMMPQKLEEVTV
jgi:hypothetical protein